MTTWFDRGCMCLSLSKFQDHKAKNKKFLGQGNNMITLQRNHQLSLFSIISMATTLRPTKSTFPQHFVFTHANPPSIEMSPFDKEKSHRPTLSTVLTLSGPYYNYRVAKSRFIVVHMENKVNNTRIHFVLCTHNCIPTFAQP